MRVLAVSPHLDDAAFSVGGTLAALVDAGHDVTVLTCFTRSVPDAQGFALACQLDKGLDPDVDYMALRRGEDTGAMGALGVAFEHLDLPEAPHRGYHSAPELFAREVADGDDATAQVHALLVERDADLWLAPQALGFHVDHLHVLRAVLALDRPTAFWADQPYALKAPQAQAPDLLPTDLVPLDLPTVPQRRLDACACYASQLGFQFGDEAAMRAALAGAPEVLLASGSGVEQAARLDGGQ